MSDSDSELLLANNVFTFQNESTMVSARGPNINANNITGLSFRNNVMSSTMQMRNNFERQRYAESNYDQQSMYRRRGTSPMSIMSACDMRQRKFNNSYYTQEMSSQRSAFNGRSGSPMSTRSIDSSASVSAADIAMAFKNMNFNKYDLRVIKDAYNKFMKQRVRKRIEKRRNLRRFLKCSRRKSGEDSGEQGSNSSLSSDDRSITTSNYKENMSSCRSTKTDISNFKRTVNNMYKDCTDNSGQTYARSMTCAPENLNSTQASATSLKSITGSNISSFRRMPLPANFNNMHRKQAIPEMTQKDRFKSGFLLPSRRFIRSATSTIPENAENVYHSGRNNLENGKDNGMNRNDNSARNIETDSDQDDIFSETTTKQKVNNVVQRKRSIDSDDDICLPSQKRTKIASPYKNGIEARKPKPKDSNLNTHNNYKENDFVFAKPTFPIRKSVKEKLISKSTAPSTETLEHVSIIPHENIQNSNVGKNVEQDKEQDLENESSNSTHSTTNLSMRPSFIKRKLFTQKLDVSEKRNMSTESINSPQNSIYDAIQKEKHKARKLQQVTTQSCLSRDVQQDESNLLDLIHKIVPLEQMNVTNQTNKTDLQLSKNKSEENEDKWDVTSIISARKNDEDVSDTYTDEEIFNATIKELVNEKVSKKPSPIKGKKESVKDIAKKLSPMKGKKQVTKENSIKKPSPMKNKNCKVLVEKLPANSSLQNHKKMAMEDVANKSVQKCIKSFWDTDFESDAECQPQSRIGNLNFKENNGKEILQPKENSKYQGFSNMFNSKKPATASMANASTYINNTVDSLHKFDITSLRIRSHRTPKRKKIEQTRDEKEKSVLFEPQSKKQKTLQARSCKQLSKPDSQAKTDIQKEKPKETMTTPHSKHQNKKSPKTKQKASKIDKHNDSTESVGELPTKKQNNSTKKQLKTAHNEPKSMNNENETVQCKQDTKKEITNNKLNKTTQKSNNKNQKNTQTLEPDRKSKSNKTTQSQQKGDNKKQDIKDNEQLKKQSNKINTREKLTQDDKKNKNQTHSSKKPAETRNRNKKLSPKIKNVTIKNLIENNSSPNKDTTIEENNNDSYRPVRSCRISNQNKTLDKTNLTLNGSRTLRSRQIDLSSTSNGNIKKATQNVKDCKSRLSDVSFSLAAKNKALSKRAGTKMTNSHLFKAKDIETSDVSFSLTINESPTPKKALSRVNSKAGQKKNSATKSTPLKQSAIQSKNLFISKNELKPNNRNRIPNKRYLMC